MTTPASHEPRQPDLESFLDFVNTRSYTDGAPEEGLPTPDAAIAFLAGRTGLPAAALSRQAAPDPDAWLGRIHEARAALREVWDAQVDGRGPDPAAIGTVNLALRRQPPVELRPVANGVDVGRAAGDDPTGEALASLIEPFVASLLRGDAPRYRVCANDGCRWVFEDTSRAGRRRWCEMATCGNRAKVARYRARRRQVGGASTAASAHDASS